MTSARASAARICFLSSEHPPYDKRVYDKEARSLVAAGFEVMHLCPDHTPLDGRDDGVAIVQYPSRHGKLHRLVGLVDLYRRARTLDADAYHCNEPDSWLVGIALKLLRRKVVVFDSHEHYPGQAARWLPRGLRTLGSMAVRLYLQLAGLVTDKIILAKYSIEPDFSLSRRRTAVILNTSPLKALQDWDAAIEELRFREPGFRFAHIGVIRRERGSEQLLDAMKHLMDRGHRSFLMIIVGEFKDGSQNAFFERARALGIDGRIEFHPWMPYEKAFELVRHSHAGLVLFQRGVSNNVLGMPHKMFDYMLAGIPVIAPDFAPDIAHVIRKSDAGLLIDTGSGEAIAAAMQALMDDRTEAARLGANGRRAVEATYNWEAEADKLADIYRGLLGPHPEQPERARHSPRS